MTKNLNEKDLPVPTDCEVLDDSDDDDSFQDLVIKFSNLASLLESGSGRFGLAYDGDIRHKIARTDQAVLIGVSKQDHLQHLSVGRAPENDARVMSDICKMQLGMKPSKVKLLTPNTKAPTRGHIKTAIKDACKSAGAEDLILVFFSGHGYYRKEDHYLIPQDFTMDNIKRSGITARNLLDWISKSRCEKIILILDCCYAELFTEGLYRVKSEMGLDKHIYLLASSEIDQPSVSDESWLEHGYMTFFVKHYFNFVCNKQFQVSLRKLTRFIKKYSVPLSRFTYTVYDGQIEQRPVLVHLGADDSVEVDAQYPGEPALDPQLVEYWRHRIQKSRAYQTWWKDRMADAKVLLSAPTFSYSRLLYLLHLNSLHSLCILLCEGDHVHFALTTPAQLAAFSAALEGLVGAALEGVAHEAFERVDAAVADVRRVVRCGVSEGERSVTTPTAPPAELVLTETLIN